MFPVTPKINFQNKLAKELVFLPGQLSKQFKSQMETVLKDIGLRGKYKDQRKMRCGYGLKVTLPAPNKEVEEKEDLGFHASPACKRLWPGEAKQDVYSQNHPNHSTRRKITR